MRRLERAFVWGGGAVFVASLAIGIYAYVVTWAAARPFDAGAGWRAIAANGALFAAFAFHHSLFAREGVKTRLERVLPDRLLRPVYVWIASLIWIVVIGFWRPVGGVMFGHTGALAAAHAVLQLAGVILIARSVGVIDPLELAGIRRSAAGGALQIRGPYRLVRHPLYLGWMLIVFGAATMTGDRLAFAVLTSFYLLLAMPWEERSLERTFGDAYRAYRRQVRWRVLPYLY